jgi:hypothetical protein
VFKKLAVSLPLSHHILDTHLKDFYKAPTAKIDVSLSTSDKVLSIYA